MHLSSRVREIKESITLKLNARAMELTDQGKLVFNLTAGQLPFRPAPELVELINKELSFVKSYQYSPVAGFNDLRSKIIHEIQKVRGIDFKKQEIDVDCVVSNGAKHSIANIMATILDKGDEVIVLAPYWVSYPEMISLYGGETIVVKSNIYNHFAPLIDDIKKSISPKTRAIIINSPTNPTGIHYSDEWMKAFGEMMLKHPDIYIVSDEIYCQLYYFDPKPTYYYHHFPELLKQTVIVDGISKTLACTGLRIGYTIADKKLTNAISKLQGQTTSGASSLVQRALVNLDFQLVEKYLVPIKTHLRSNAQIIREAFRQVNLAHEWYQSTSAFYYMVDFSRTPLMNKFRKNEQDKGDYSHEICEYLLEKEGLVMVPGTDFGMDNSARISLVMEKAPFEDAMNRLAKRLVEQ